MAIHISSGETFPEPARAANVEMGRRDYISTLWRLTRMEIYKLRRRTYSKVLLFILLSLIGIATLIIGFFALSQANSPASNLVPPSCATVTKSYCTNTTYTSAQLTQIKSETMQSNANALGFPGSLAIIAIVFSQGLMALLGLALLGPITGGEYSMGTIRLLFTRGPTRLQCMLAKVSASLIYTVAMLLILAVVYILVGMLVYPMAGEPYSYTFGHLHSSGFGILFGNSLLLIVIAIGYWFTYGMMALFFGTLGRSTAAAIGAAFSWYVLESLLSFGMGFLQGKVQTGPIHELAKALPTYLLSNNFGSLVQNRLHTLFGQQLSPISDIHALIVLAVYLVVLIGGSCLLAARRDVTN
jgi:ABC-type transport system involved in multi-copper enzyme maturation permease subunit